MADDVRRRALRVGERGSDLHAAWDEHFASWRAEHAEQAALLDRLRTSTLPDGWAHTVPSFEPGKAVATRRASGEVLTALAPVLPELWGGSADLAGSNNTTPKDELSFLPPDRSSKEFEGDWYGRVLHFGIREHAMGSILNGIALHGLTRPYGGTFLVFSDYMRPAVRLAALMGLPVTYVWTHDSVGLGEDGPTHQPVEHLAALRAIPGLDVVRPADANETAVAWRTILEHHATNQSAPGRSVPDPPERADLPARNRRLRRRRRRHARRIRAPRHRRSTRRRARSAPVPRSSSRSRLVTCWPLTASRRGSCRCRAVSGSTVEDQAYRDDVLPPDRAGPGVGRGGRRAGLARLVGDAGRSVSLEHFGASADYQILFREFGITAEAVVAAAKESIAAAG